MPDLRSTPLKAGSASARARRGRWGLPIGALALCAGFAAADPLSAQRIDPRALKDAGLDALLRLDPAYAVNVQRLARVPPGARVAVVGAAGALLRSWTDSADFRQRYESWRTAQLPPLPVPPPNRVLDGRLAAPLAAEEQRFVREKAAYEAAATRLPADPRRRIRALVERFLDATGDVDWKAALREQGGLLVFVRPDYERKPPAWKAAFRAGADATLAARAFARAWLDELPR